MKEKKIRRFTLGHYSEEILLLKAVEVIRKANIPIFDVYTPYAVHGLDDAMGIKRTLLPRVTFIASFLGLSFAIWFQWWVFSVNWPINFGGKPFFALPAFIPVAFEITVLAGGLCTVLAFLIRSRLFPGAEPMQFSNKATDDQFIIAIARNDASLSDAVLRNIFEKTGAEVVCDGEWVS